jgi:hypothetical protein
LAVVMHEEPESEHQALALPPAAPPPPTPGEWAIGIVFVLAALGMVAWIAWAIAGLPT